MMVIMIGIMIMVNIRFFNNFNMVNFRYSYEIILIVKYRKVFFFCVVSFVWCLFFVIIRFLLGYCYVGWNFFYF